MPVMATNYLTDETWTVTQAAGKFRRTTARIRQICIAHGIGKLIKGQVRLLSADDVRRIGKIIADAGYK